MLGKLEVEKVCSAVFSPLLCVSHSTLRDIRSWWRFLSLFSYSHPCIQTNPAELLYTRKKEKFPFIDSARTLCVCGTYEHKNRMGQAEKRSVVVVVPLIQKFQLNKTDVSIHILTTRLQYRLEFVHNEKVFWRCSNHYVLLVLPHSCSPIYIFAFRYPSAFFINILRIIIVQPSIAINMHT